MTFVSSEPEDPDELEPEYLWRREKDRKEYDEFWDSPTFERWRKGGKWT